MDQVILLPAENGVFEVRVESGTSWARISWKTESTELRLGAEDWNILKTKLSKALAETRAEGEPRWALSLAEAHFSLFVRHSKGELNLLLVGPDARTEATAVLSAVQRLDWLAELS